MPVKIAGSGLHNDGKRRRRLGIKNTKRKSGGALQEVISADRKTRVR